MPAHARNGSTRSRAISTWRTQIWFTRSNNLPDFATGCGRVRFAPGPRQGDCRRRDGERDLSRAKERYEAARLGPTREERAIANAKVEVAVAAVAVIAARVAKLRIRAPSDGAVALLVAEPGEAVAPGQPLMTLEEPGRGWASFNLREDQLDGLSIGLPIEVMLADRSAPINARIDEIAPRGEFATWRAARAVGDYDLNTFVIRADPFGRAEGMQPGMTVWLHRQ
jgi:HlyD family secretion protein